jgi:hypothetical protein
MKNVLSLTAVVLASMLIFGAGMVKAELIVDGSFEDTININTGLPSTGYYNASAPPGWSWTGAGTAPYVVGGNSDSGSPFTNVYPWNGLGRAVLFGNGYKGLSQSFALTTAPQVTFNFDFAEASIGAGSTNVTFSSAQGNSAVFGLANGTLSVNGTSVLENIPTYTYWYNVNGIFDYAAGTFAGNVTKMNKADWTPIAAATFSGTIASGVTGIDTVAISFGDGAKGAIYYDSFSVVPEPATMTLLGLGIAGMFVRRK